MLAIYPVVLMLFAVTMFAYILIAGGVHLKLPQLKREELNPSELFRTFSELYPKVEEKREDKVPSLRVIATATGAVRMALVEVEGSPKTLRIGTQVDGYRVTSIERNYIVLSRGDRRLAIGFKLSPEAPQQASASRPSQHAQPQTSKSLQASIPKGELERVTADPGIMFRQIRLVPFVQGGRTRGFLFEWIEPGSLFERSGIRPGDVLLSINNQDIKSGEDAFRILQVLRNESSIKLNLQRDSELIELSLRVE